MADNIETIVLAHLTRLQITLERVGAKQDDLVRLMGNLESGQVSLLQQITHHSSTVVHLRLSRLELI